MDEPGLPRGRGFESTAELKRCCTWRRHRWHARNEIAGGATSLRQWRWWSLGRIAYGVVRKNTI